MSLSGAYWPNRLLDRAAPYSPRQAAILNQEANAAAWREIRAWPGYAATPLVELPGLARKSNIAQLLYKDESRRFALMSFKALGGAYAVQRILSLRLVECGVAAASSELLISGRWREITGAVTVAAATDGNHGRSVAWGAQMFHCRCIIYLHENVSRKREDEIARYGAEIRRVAGGYDRSVHQCADDARREGWALVADTSANGDPFAPSLVMQGYTLLAQELSEQTRSLGVTHIFAPAAVGGLAAALVGSYWERDGAARPAIVAVQPSIADALARSVEAGTQTPAPGEPDTFMACLAAAEVSPAAWEVLETGLDGVVTIPDDAARETMRLLARGEDGNPALVSGESGCAATAGFLAAAGDPAIAAAVGLNRDSVVAVIGSEGATDAEIYRQTVGMTPEAVGAKERP